MPVSVVLESGWIASIPDELFTMRIRTLEGALKFAEFAPVAVLNFSATLQSAPTVYVPDAVERVTPLPV